MRYVGDICAGGKRYGYVHQPVRNRQLTKKVAILKRQACTDIVCDIGSRENLDGLLDKATFRDHILFYDHSVFQTQSELHDIYDLGIGPANGSPSFTCDFHKEETLLDLSHTAEETSAFRRKNARRRKVKAAIGWVVDILSVFKLRNYI